MPAPATLLDGSAPRFPLPSADPPSWTILVMLGRAIIMSPPGRIAAMGGACDNEKRGGKRVEGFPQDKNLSAIQKTVEQELQKHGLLAGNAIQVSVGNGAITLTGTVQTLAQKN